MPPPQHQLTTEAAHDLAGALRGLPEALEGLNERIEQASSKVELEQRVVDLQRQMDERQRGFETKQASTRRRTVVSILVVTALAIFVSIAFVILVPIANHRDQVDRNNAQLAILQRATGANAVKAQQDFADLLLARMRCQTQLDLQIEYEAATGRKNLIFNPPACQAVVDALQNKLTSDLAGVQSPPPTTSTTRPKSGSGTKPGSPGPTTPPGTSPTTQPPSSPPTTQPSPPPSTPPSTVVCVTSPVVDGCVKDPRP